MLTRRTTLRAAAGIGGMLLATAIGAGASFAQDDAVAAYREALKPYMGGIERIGAA